MPTETTLEAPWKFVMNPHHAIGYMRAASGRSFATISWDKSKGYQHDADEKLALKACGELMAKAPELERALRDVLSCFDADRSTITDERVEAWRAALL
jgi:hypothetical protein